MIRRWIQPPHAARNHLGQGTILIGNLNLVFVFFRIPKPRSAPANFNSVSDAFKKRPQTSISRSRGAV